MDFEDRVQDLVETYGLSPAAVSQVVGSLHPEQRKFAGLRKFAAEYVMSSLFPNLSAAFQAYQSSKEEENSREYAANAMKFPALHSSQPQMLAMQQQMMYGGGMGASPAQPVHHRRHRHHL